MYTYNGRIVYVVDADTVDVELDLGFDIKFKQRIRLLGVDAPERFTDDGKVATEFVKNWAAAHPAVVVQTFKNTYDKYGRYVALIASATDTQELGQALVAAGLGKTTY